MSAPEGNNLFCFPVSLRENKTNYFPRAREQTLRVLLYSDEQKSTFNNIHTTIVFRDKNSIVHVNEFKIKRTYLNGFSSIYCCLLCIFLLFYILYKYLNTNLENRSF